MKLDGILWQMNATSARSDLDQQSIGHEKFCIVTIIPMKLDGILLK
jgi:hypothetical protein